MSTTVFRGDVFTLAFTIKQSDGTVLDLTGATIRFMAKKRLSDTDANAVIDKGVTIDNATSGLASVGLDATDTANPLCLIAEVEVTTAGSDILSAQFTLDIVDDVRKGP